MIGFGLFWAFGVCLAVILVGHLAKWILDNFLSEREAAIAAFSFMLGQSLAVGVLNIWGQVESAIAEAIGTVMGFAFLWWSFFRRRPFYD